MSVLLTRERDLDLQGVPVLDHTQPIRTVASRRPVSRRIVGVAQERRRSRLDHLAGVLLDCEEDAEWAGRMLRYLGAAGFVVAALAFAGKARQLRLWELFEGDATVQFLFILIGLCVFGVVLLGTWALCGAAGMSSRAEERGDF